MRAASNLDLVLQGGLHEKPDQVVVLQHRAARDDRPGDFDLVQGHDVDQGGGRPFGVGQALGEASPDIALGLDHQGHEDGVQQRLDVRVGRLASGSSRLAKIDDATEQAFAIVGIAATRQRHQRSDLDGLNGPALNESGRFDKDDLAALK